MQYDLEIMGHSLYSTILNYFNSLYFKYTKLIFI